MSTSTCKQEVEPCDHVYMKDCERRTSNTAAAFFTLEFMLEVVAFSITAAIGEADALPVHWVVVPACETCTTWSCVGGL